MAKKKKEEGESGGGIADPGAIGKFDIKNFEQCFRTVEEKFKIPKKVIPITPSLDDALGGGIPESSFVIFTGPPKVGKSTAILHFSANCQLPEYGNKKIYYCNVEGRIKQRDIDGIPALDQSPDKFRMIESVEDKILYAHDHLDIALHLLKNEKNCVVIIDSVSQLCSQGRVAESVGSRYRDDAPLMLASFTKQAANLLPIYNNIVIIVTHIIANQGNGMSPTMEASGKKVQYQGDVKIKGEYQQPYLVGEDQVGQEVHWKVEFSAIGPPMQKCTSLLRYGLGLDKEYDLITMCTEIGLIQKGGAWYTIGEQKVQGMEKSCSYLRENPELYKELYKKYKEITA